MNFSEKRYLIAEPIVAWGAFFILLATYWLTVAPSVSFWDCPEYVSSGYLLEVGHPPGNPTWMLTERIVTMFVPPGYAALAINLSSGLFTAFAAFFLAKTIFRVALWILLKLPRKNIPAPLAAGGAAFVGALAFGWCDSVWFSAVEAEVYAMSIFMTSLCVWLMTKWAGTSNRGDSWRLLVLIAYLFGLSIGVHQLNLLCIPALAMIWAVRRGIRSWIKIIVIFIISLIAVACVLAGMMPSTIALASRFELIAVNYLNLPFLSGVVIYLLLLGLSLLAALYAVGHTSNRLLMATTCFPAIFLSGVFIFSEHFLWGMVISAAAAGLLVAGSNFKARRLYLSIWMLAMLLTGYSSYALIPLRGNVAAPSNAAMPGNPFSFATYQSREQYGSKPLLYGATPYSKPLVKELIDSTGKAVYPIYSLEYQGTVFSPKENDAVLRKSVIGIEESDSIENHRLLAREGDAYIVTAMRSRNITTPELDIWFPRVTGTTPFDISSYSGWIGMDTSNMVRVEISEAVDSAGNFVTKMDSEGNRRHPYSYRPTYLQNLKWLVAYQTYYMYWRYVFWNFVGRQNDRASQGEVQHGNFITGITGVDNLMLGAEDKLPPSAGKENKGRNIYYGLPFILGILGICWLAVGGRRGRRADAVIAVLFVMTGLAITVYLNQGPGEPRERDYSFLGSYMAYCIYIAFGAVMIARLLRSVWGFVIPLVVVLWMGFVNYDDHDRSNRHVAENFAANLLNSVEPDAIIFVNGDNYTFPLWYAQEVRGIRPDVRVVNLAYLNSALYSANLMADWRESKALPSTLKRGDIIWEDFRITRYPLENTDTSASHEALKKMKAAGSHTFPTRYVTIPLTPDSAIVFDLRMISKKGSIVDFQKLLIFDIISTNAVSENPRPIYWIGAVGKSPRLGLEEAMSPWILGYRFGLLDQKRIDSLMLAAADGFVPPNPPGKNVYMDPVPSTHISVMRAALINASRRLLRNGYVDEAVSVANRADILMGETPESFKPVSIADSSFNVREELGRLLVECSDSLESRIDRSPQYGYYRARCLELRARGLMHLDKNDELKKAWQQYRQALPKNLRKNVSATF